jgi:hypothetical protein
VSPRCSPTRSRKPKSPLPSGSSESPSRRTAEASSWRSPRQVWAPGYGIAELACRDGAWTWLEWAAYEPRAGSLLARPFPSDEEKATLAARRGRLQDEAAATGHAAVTAFRAAEDELYPAMTAGAVQLSHEGCGYYTWLVVTGDERGTLWFDPWCSDSPLAPLGDPGHVGFAEWYLAWLDEMATTAR